MPGISNVRDLTHIFPNLIVKDILETDSLDKVNNFQPNEKSYKIGTVEFTEKKSVDLYLNLWYLENGPKNTGPLIVEFTFNYESKHRSQKNDTLLEEFPPNVVRKTNSFYHLLQERK